MRDLQAAELHFAKPGSDSQRPRVQELAAETPSPSTKTRIDPNWNCRIFRMRWDSLASKGLFGFPPSGYEISGLNGEEGILSLETLQLVFSQRTRRDEIYQLVMCRFAQAAKFAQGTR